MSNDALERNLSLPFHLTRCSSGVVTDVEFMPEDSPQSMAVKQGEKMA